MIKRIEHISLSKDLFLLIRHGSDVDNLTVELNQPLSDVGVGEVLELSHEIKKIVNSFCGVCIFYSPSIRTTETSLILSRFLFDNKVCVLLNKTQAIREFFQGNFIVDPAYVNAGEYLPLKTAWNVFIDQVKNKNNLDYCFGDCSVAKNNDYFLLKEIFLSCGESQNSFLKRIGNFIARDLSSLNNDYLNIVVTHQAVSSRIQREIHRICNLDSDNSCWNGERVSLGHADGVVVKVPKLNLTSI